MYDITTVIQLIYEWSGQGNESKGQICQCIDNRYDKMKLNTVMLEYDLVLPKSARKNMN